MTTTSTPRLSAYDLRVEYRTTPLGIDEPAPRFSWRLASEGRGAAQTGSRIRVVAASATRDGSDSLVWDSGWEERSDGVGAVYDGSPLAPSTRYRWALTLRDDQGGEHNAGASWFETGLLSSPLRARWVHRVLNPDQAVNPPDLSSPSAAVRRLFPSGYFRGEFEAGENLISARLYATAHGLYEPYVNGGRVGDHKLAPGWTDYRDRLMYQTFDITDRIRVGRNAVGSILGEGWWSGFYGSDRRQQGYHWGHFPEVWMQVLLEYANGRTEVIGTDSSWRYAYGPILYSDLLMGEYVDARLDLGDWSAPGFDASSWTPAVVRDGDLHALVGMSDEPIRVMEELPAQSVREVGGSWIVDFGQNLSGLVRFDFTESAGTTIRIRYGELLDEDGALYTENLRTAEATDVYVCAGEGPERFEPTFTSHGFRFAELTGLSSAPPLSSMTAITLRNDIPWSGTLLTSDDQVNQLERNIRWGQRGNFVAVPTDCPQRDERLGWTADAQVFFPTAAYNADVLSFFSRWMRDVRFGQTADGSFPDVAPKITILTEGAPAWGDAGVIIPWELYLAYGDKRILAESWDSVHRWIDFLAENNPDLIWRRRVGKNYGDWLQIDCETPRDVLATAYFAHSTDLVAQIARVLDKPADAAGYASLAERIRLAFAEHFAGPDLKIEGDTQTVYLLALAFDLFPEPARATLADHLVRTIVDHDTSLTTGFVGVPLLCPVLTKIGRSDLAYALLQRRDYPSWQYSIRHGATTIWERWDGWTEERGFQAPKMNSFNHYALGSVGEWMYRTMGGIDQERGSAAFRETVIAPVPGGGLSWVKAAYDTPLGRIASDWQFEDGRFTLSVSIPPGSGARVVLPAAEGATVWLDDHEIEDGPFATVLGRTDDSVTVRVASGSYRFASDAVQGVDDGAAIAGAARLA